MQDLYIDTPEALLQLCDGLARGGWLALDTEFVRERTYYPQLCLIQVADDETVACIDVLALNDLQPLMAVIYDPEIIKVVHGGQQDLETFHHLRGSPPAGMFDTQIAAAVLGHGEQVGYASLVSAMLGVELDKSMTRTDWSHRPLHADQLRYAADDARYLRDIYRKQRQELIARGRWDWLKTDMQSLSDPTRYCVRPKDAWLKVKRHSSLRDAQLVVLQHLAAWREREAANRDRPRRWIVSDEVLVELARRKIASPEELARVRGLRESQLKQHGKALLEMTASGRSLPRAQWPQLPSRIRLDPNQEALTDVLMAVVRMCGQENDVNPGILASRRDLESIVAGERDLPLLKGWRARVAGDSVLNYLDGDLSLEVEGGRLVMVSPDNQ